MLNFDLNEFVKDIILNYQKIPFTDICVRENFNCTEQNGVTRTNVRTFVEKTITDNIKMVIGINITKVENKDVTIIPHLVLRGVNPEWFLQISLGIRPSHYFDDPLQAASRDLIMIRLLMDKIKIGENNNQEFSVKYFTEN
jgi:hypothetical protein